jgi:hypothetical protein
MFAKMLTDGKGSGLDIQFDIHILTIVRGAKS